VSDVPTVIVLRTLAFVVEAILAYALASTREVTRRQVTDFVSLLDALKTPVMVSDIDGAILYANEPMCDAIGREAEDVKDSSFVRHFFLGLRFLTTSINTPTCSSASRKPAEPRKT